MYLEIQQFTNWLTCQYPTSSIRVHYHSDLVLFFSWANKPPADITVHDVDAFIAHCQREGHAAIKLAKGYQRAIGNLTLHPQVAHRWRDAPHAERAPISIAMSWRDLPVMPERVVDL